MDAGLATVLLVVATTLPSPPEQSSERVAQRVKALAPRLAAGEPGVRARAEQSLLDLGPEAAGVLLEAMIVAPLDQRRAIRAILPEFGPAAVDTLYQGTERIAAGRPLEDYQAIQDEGAAIVAEMGEPAVPELYELLEEGRPSPPEGWPDPVSPSPPQVFAVLALSKMDPSLLRPFRRTAMLGMVTFYAGYGVGWLALWGFFGA